MRKRFILNTYLWAFFFLLHSFIFGQKSGLLLNEQQVMRIVELHQTEQIVQYLKEIKSLGSRSVGAEGLRLTADWLKSNLKKLGYEILGSQYFMVTAPVDTGATLTFSRGDSTFERSIYCMWPNLVAVPFVPKSGLTAPLVYAGRGNLIDFDGKEIHREGKPGAIILMDYNSQRRWETAAVLGAAAVIFLPDPHANHEENIAKFSNIPLQFPRFYLNDPTTAGELIKLANRDFEVTIRGGMQFENVRCENIVAFLPANISTETGETLMLHINYDAPSVVPGISEGGQNAENIAALLQVLEALADQRLDISRNQNLLIFFNSAHSMWNTGARQFANMLRDMMGLRRIELQRRKSQGEEISDRQQWLIDSFTDLEPWMDKRLLSYRIIKGRIAAALEWLKNSTEEHAAFEYMDPAAVDRSDFINFKTAREWLYENLKDEITIHHIESIARVAELYKAFDIDPNKFLQDSKLPEQLRAEKQRKHYYSLLLQENTPEEMLRAMQNSEVNPGVLGENDITRTFLETQFKEDLHAIQTKIDLLKSSVDLRNKLEKLDINRCISMEISGGNSVLSMHYTTSGSVEFQFTLGPALSQKLELLSNLANRALSQPVASVFDFVDGITFDASRKRQVSSAKKYFMNREIAHAAVSEYNFGTGNDSRSTSLGPGDRILMDEKSISNLTKQSRTLTLLLAHELIDPGLFQLRSKEFNHRTIAIRGVVVKNDVHSGPFPKLPVPNSIVCFNTDVQFPERQSAFQTLYFLTGRDGRFDFENINAEDWKFGVIPQTIKLNAYRLSPENGMVEYAPDMNSSLGGSNLEVNLAQAVDVFRRIVVFDGAAVQLYGAIDPMRMAPIEQMQIYEGRDGGIDNLFIHSELPSLLDKSTNKVVVVPKNHHIKFVARTPLLNDMRMFLLGSDKDNPGGSGYPVGNGLNFTHTVLSSARDLWQLNDFRLTGIEAKGIRNNIARQLHDQSSRDLQAMDNALQEKQYSLAYYLARNIWGRELRAYPEIKSITDQAVIAVVLLLAFLIPWAYFLERIVLQSRSILGRIGGFIGFFAAASAFLFYIHPAFQITKTPLMILIAYTLGGMAFLSLAVVMKKYSGMMKRWRINVGGIHSSDISRGSAFTIAFNLGLTNMAKRPLRTVLTIITVALLAFSATTFTSIDTYLDTRMVPVAAAGKVPFNGVLFRQYDWTTISPMTAQTFEEDLGAGVETVRRNWYQKIEGGYAIGLGLNKFNFVRQDTNLIHVAECLQGFMVAEKNFSGIDQCVTGSWFSGRDDEIILPTVAAQNLGITEADVIDIPEEQQIRVNYGSEVFRVIGILNSKAAEQLVDVSGTPLTHLDYNGSGLWSIPVGLPAYNAYKQVGYEGDAVFYGFDKTVLLPYAKLKNLGGQIKSVVAKFSDDIDPRSAINALMSRLAINIYASLDGRPYLVKTATAQSISGIWKMVVPVLLVILIMINTMLGTVDERKEEIKMLGAVGLSPKHVTTLYLAESCVYGVFGVVFGVFLGLMVEMLTGNVELGLNVNYASISTMVMGILVIAIVVVATLIPANLAARLATPSGAGKWGCKESDSGEMSMRLPFAMTQKNGLGIFAFLYEYLDGHWAATSSNFRCSELKASAYHGENGHPGLLIKGRIWLAPYDMRVSHLVSINFSRNQNDLLFEVTFRASRLTGLLSAWERANYVFLDLLRKQFLIFRTLSEAQKKSYLNKARTLISLSEANVRSA